MVVLQFVRKVETKSYLTDNLKKSYIARLQIQDKNSRAFSNTHTGALIKCFVTKVSLGPRSRASRHHSHSSWSGGVNPWLLEILWNPVDSPCDPCLPPLRKVCCGLTCWGRGLLDESPVSFRPGGLCSGLLGPWQTLFFPAEKI